MNELFLKYLWKYKLMKNPLVLNNGQKFEIINTGIENFNAGPDFLNAIIKIDDTTWAGNVEIHVKSSDWNLHGHNNDHAYDNVILHVVYSDDCVVYNASSRQIQNYCIGNSLPSNVYKRYLRFLKSKKTVPCSNKIISINNIVVKNTLTRLVIERFERKTNEFFLDADVLKNNWEEAFYRLLSKSFGFGVNSQPFHRLACITPLKILAREGSSISMVEALLFGQSGLLPNLTIDDYCLKLKTDYSYLMSKYDLQSMNSYEWKFLRVRPLNFPTIRISQLANLLKNNYPLFNKIIEYPVKRIIEIFKANASEYWDNHYVFGNIKKISIEKRLSVNSAHLLIINSVVPMLFMYGYYKNDNYLKQKAIDILYNLPGENNKITRQWLDFGITISSAADSQALLELETMYCNKRLCLKCGIGHCIINAE